MQLKVLLAAKQRLTAAPAIFSARGRRNISNWENDSRELIIRADAHFLVVQNVQIAIRNNQGLLRFMQAGEVQAGSRLQPESGREAARPAP